MISEISVRITFAISPKGLDDETRRDPETTKGRVSSCFRGLLSPDANCRGRCVPLDGERFPVGVWLPCLDAKSLRVADKEDWRLTASEPFSVTGKGMRPIRGGSSSAAFDDISVFFDGSSK